MGGDFLFILDDAKDIDDATALKVGGRNCSHLLTTQSQSIAREFALHNVELLISLGKTEKLDFAKSLAPNAFEDVPEELEQVIDLVSGFPLEIEVIGKRLNTISGTGNRSRLLRFIQLIQDPQERLNLSVSVPASEQLSSSSKDQHKSLNQSLYASYSILELPDQRMLQSLLVFPPQPNTFSEKAALEVTNGSFKSLESLSDISLIVNSGEGRYSIHQLIHEFGKKQLDIPLPYDRLIDFFLNNKREFSVHFNELKEDAENVRVAIQYAIDHSLYQNAIDLINLQYQYLESVGQYKRAGEYLDQAEQLSDKKHDDARLIETWINRGRLLKSLGDFGEAESIFKQALEKLDVVPERPDLLCKALEGLGVTIVNLPGRMNDAEGYLREGLEIARNQYLKPELCNMLQNLSSIQYRRGNYEQATIFLNEEIGILDEIGYLLTKCHMLINLGGIASELGDFETAESKISESVEIARNLRHLHMISHTLNQLGGVKNSQKKYHSALDDLYELLPIAEKLANQPLIMVAKRNIGEAEGHLGKLKKADKYFTEALEIARSIKDGYNITTILCEWGEVLLLRLDEKTANNYFEEAVQRASEENDKELIATGKFGLGRCANLGTIVLWRERLGMKV